MKLGDATSDTTPEQLRKWFEVDLCSLTGIPRLNILSTRIHAPVLDQLLDVGFWPACHGVGGWAFRHG